MASAPSAVFSQTVPDAVCSLDEVNAGTADDAWEIWESSSRYQAGNGSTVFLGFNRTAAIDPTQPTRLSFSVDTAYDGAGQISVVLFDGGLRDSIATELEDPFLLANYAQASRFTSRAVYHPQTHTFTADFPASQLFPNGPSAFAVVYENPASPLASVTLINNPAVQSITLQQVSGPPTVTVPPQPSFAYESWQVSLSAGATDPSGASLIYQWNQATGKAVTLAGATTPSASFTVPRLETTTDAAMTFQFLATNDAGVTGPAGWAAVQAYMMGDINHDNYVNVADLQVLVAAWASQQALPCGTWNAAADLSNDGYVNVGDLQLLVASWGRQLPDPAATSGSSSSIVLWSKVKVTQGSSTTGIQTTGGTLDQQPVPPVNQSTIRIPVTAGVTLNPAAVDASKFTVTAPLYNVTVTQTATGGSKVTTSKDPIAQIKIPVLSATWGVDASNNQYVDVQTGEQVPGGVKISIDPSAYVTPPSAPVVGAISSMTPGALDATKFVLANRQRLTPQDERIFEGFIYNNGSWGFDVPQANWTETQAQTTLTNSLSTRPYLTQAQKDWAWNVFNNGQNRFLDPQIRAAAACTVGTPAQWAVDDIMNGVSNVKFIAFDDAKASANGKLDWTKSIRAPYDMKDSQGNVLYPTGTYGVFFAHNYTGVEPIEGLAALIGHEGGNDSTQNDPIGASTVPEEVLVDISRLATLGILYAANPALAHAQTPLTWDNNTNLLAYLNSGPLAKGGGFLPDEGIQTSLNTPLTSNVFPGPNGWPLNSSYENTRDSALAIGCFDRPCYGGRYTDQRYCQMLWMKADSSGFLLDAIDELYSLDHLGQ